MRASWILGLLAVLMIAQCALAYQVVLLPTSDAQADRAAYGQPDVVTNPPDFGIFMQHNLSNTGELHEGLLEFSLAALPAEATVTSASLTYGVNLITGDGSYPSLNVNLYNGGDGVATLSDLYKNTVNVAQSQDLTAVGTYTTDFFSVLALNDRATYFSSGFVGVKLFPRVEWLQTRIWSVEDAELYQAQAPTLTIDYTLAPEPTTLLLLGVGGVLLAIGWRVKRNR